MEFITHVTKIYGKNTCIIKIKIKTTLFTVGSTSNHLGSWPDSGADHGLKEREWVPFKA